MLALNSTISTYKELGLIDNQQYLELKQLEEHQDCYDSDNVDELFLKIIGGLPCVFVANYSNIHKTNNCALYRKKLNKLFGDIKDEKTLEYFYTFCKAKLGVD